MYSKLTLSQRAIRSKWHLGLVAVEAEREHEGVEAARQHVVVKDRLRYHPPRRLKPLQLRVRRVERERVGR
jgi:hypothetical protein